MKNEDMNTQPSDAAEQYHLGLLYEIGLGVTQDHEQALKWYTESAEQGNPTAQYHLGIMYSTGRGVTQDSEQAVKWFTKAAEQGDLDSQSHLEGYDFS